MSISAVGTTKHPLPGATRRACRCRGGRDMSSQDDLLDLIQMPRGSHKMTSFLGSILHVALIVVVLQSTRLHSSSVNEETNDFMGLQASEISILL